MMNVLSFFLSATLLLVGFSAPARAGEEEAARGAQARVARLMALVDARYSGFTAFEARFVQRTIDPSGGVVEARGRVYLQPPSMMRWEYTAPERQLMVTDGGEVLLYEPDEAQVMVMARGGPFSRAISRAFFWGKEGVEKAFRVLPVCRGRGAGCGESAFAASADPGRSLLLLPRDGLEGQGIRAIVVEVDPATGAIQRMWIENEMGSVTHIAFSDMKWGRPHPRAFFRFTIPKGVTVYREGGMGMGVQEQKSD